MSFSVGDKVIHCNFGLGEITKVEERMINEQSQNCYVFTMDTMTIWVPVENLGKNSLRLPTSPEEFEATLKVLTSQEEALPSDRLLRKKYLLDLVRSGQLSSMCEVVRDLTHYKKNFKLNDEEKSILERAIRSLLMEWTLSLGTPPIQANQSLELMLQ
jgi:RNA polymerase-interacting CarD/CdnL/TRCF family regulator